MPALVHRASHQLRGRSSSDHSRAFAATGSANTISNVSRTARPNERIDPSRQFCRRECGSALRPCQCCHGDQDRLRCAYQVAQPIDAPPPFAQPQRSFPSPFPGRVGWGLQSQMCCRGRPHPGPPRKRGGRRRPRLALDRRHVNEGDEARAAGDTRRFQAHASRRSCTDSSRHCARARRARPLPAPPRRGVASGRGLRSAARPGVIAGRAGRKPPASGNSTDMRLRAISSMRRCRARDASAEQQHDVGPLARDAAPAARGRRRRSARRTHGRRGARRQAPGGGAARAPCATSPLGLNGAPGKRPKPPISTLRSLTGPASPRSRRRRAPATGCLRRPRARSAAASPSASGRKKAGRADVRRTAPTSI